MCFFLSSEEITIITISAISAIIANIAIITIASVVHARDLVLLIALFSVLIRYVA